MTFKKLLQNDLGVYWCVLLPPILLFCAIIIFITDKGTIEKSDMLEVLAMLSWVIFFCYLLAYIWYVVVRRTIENGVVCLGKVLETNVDDKSVAIQMPFAVKYEYEYQEKLIETGDTFRSKSKARDLAVVGKEITVMRSKFGGFSFIRDVYEDDAEKIDS